MDNRDKSWDEKLDSSFLRDQNFEINGERMRVTVRGFKISLAYQLITSALMMYISGIVVLYKVASVIGGSFNAVVVPLFVEGADTPGVPVFDTSGWLIAAGLGIFIIILSILGNSFNIKWAPRVISVIYPLHVIIGVLGGFGLFDDMNILSCIVFVIYGIAGFWINDLTVRGIKELDYLVTQEGFPTFNLAIFYFGRSHYVKMREKWLEKNPIDETPKKVIESEEKRMELIEVTAEDEQPGVIPNIKVTEDSANKWLEQNKAETEQKILESVTENVMDDLSTEDLVLPDSEEYYREITSPRFPRH